MEIDQDELKRAIARLMEDPPEHSTPVYYCNPLQVAREESRGQAYGKIDTGLKPDVNANRPHLGSLDAPLSVVVAEESNEESFRQAERQWQNRGSPR